MYYRLVFKKFNIIQKIRFIHTENECLPMKKLNIISYASVQHRNTIIPKVEAAVTQCGGYVDDFNFFSDMAISLRILGIRQPDTIQRFSERLQSNIRELHLDKTTIRHLHESVSDPERYALFILLQVVFMDAKGELKQLVPSVNS